MITATASRAQLDDVLSYQAGDFDQALERLFALLRVKSISTDPAYAEECHKAANILSDELMELGFQSRVAPTGGHPMVVAHSVDHAPDTPHVLFYGHYDVQPPDPLELWKSDPFDPQIIERADASKVIRARGASDDKAQLRTFLEACRAWREVAGRLPCRVSILLEGEEESGSKSMVPFLTENAAELKADYALVCDTGMWNRSTPAITLSLRGTAAGEIVVRGADRDLHSGLYGSAARNANTLLCRIIASLHDENGRVQIPGFYDGVEEPPQVLLDQWAGLDFDPIAFLGDVGLSVPAGESDRSVLEQIWTRPTAEINGMIGGYTGEGFKTVIPAEARAKISFRIVPGQDPEAVWNRFEDFVRAQLPKDCEAEFSHRPGAPALSLSASSERVALISSALKDEWGVDPVLMGSGGSIPIVGDFKRILGMDAVLAGFGLEDDNIHSPNEKYEMKSFDKGTRSWIRALAAIGGSGG